MKPVTIDFETFGILPRPDYPPRPVGVAIKLPGRKARYYAWDHQNGKNNCTREQACSALSKVWDRPLLFHNAKFDLDVAEVHLGLPLPHWSHIHDTVFLTFLDDPHQRRIDLKSTAQRLLNWPPDERDAVADWLIANQPVPGVRITRAVSGKETWGKYIAYAPPDVVGPYAIGDVDRTAALFDRLFKDIKEREMLLAYERERRLLPILLDMERRGLPIDARTLHLDVARYNETLARCEDWVLKRLRRHNDPFNLDSNEQLVAALIDAGKADAALMGLTATGKVKSDKIALAAGVSDKTLAAMLKYLAQLKTCLRTFMEPWLATAMRSGGLIYTNWNQTRGENGGTRTGRLSSTPNFQNIPKEFTPIWGKVKPPFALPPLPLCRSYIIAPNGHVLCDRDFASQELRILAHFENGKMAQGYLEQPDVDFHQLAADMITRTTGVKITRRDAKTIGFAILYGAGRGTIASRLDCSVTEVDVLLNAYFTVFPGIRLLQNNLKLRAANDKPIYTAGGREYHCEPPAIVNGRLMNFSYKLLNYLVQGSAADQTKDAMIRFHEMVGSSCLLAQVHDELLIAAPTVKKKQYMLMLKASMEAPGGLRVPVLSDGKWGSSWSTLEKSSV
jgi:DNA polymerase I